MTPFVLRGRSQELAVALSSLDRAQRSGEGSIVLVTGEPGIGKTALLRAVREQAQRRGFTVGFGAADEPDQLVPGAPLLLALRSGRAPLVDRTVSEGFARRDLQPMWIVEEVAEQIDRRAQRGPVVIVLDDVQWADRLSRFLTRVLASRLAGSPVVWVLAARGDARSAGTDVDMVAAFDDVRVEHIQLAALTHRDLIDIVSDVLETRPEPHIVAWLEQLDGVPLLAMTLAEGIAKDRTAADTWGVPAGFAERLRAGLAALTPGGLALTQLAAVWARLLPIVNATHLLDTSRAAVERELTGGARTGMLAIRNDAVTFRHDLIREFVYNEIPEVERVRLHQLIAHHLIDSGHPAIEAAPHAAVSVRAGDRRSLDILRQAASDSLLVVPNTAAELMKHAFEAVPRNDPQWAAIGEQCANALWHAQRGAESIATVDVLLSAAVEPDVRARLHVLAAQALWLMGLPQDIAVRTERQLSAPALDESHHVQLAAARALALSRVGTPGLALSLAEDALVEARRLHDRTAEILALHALGEIAKNDGRHHTAHACFHELRTSLGADFLAQEITELQHLDRFDDAQTLLNKAGERTASGAGSDSPALASAQVWQHVNLGRNDDAEVGARALIKLGNELGNFAHRADAYIAMSIVALIRGDTAHARFVIDAAEAESNVRDAPGMLLMRARFASAEGDAAEARRWLDLLYSGETAAHTYWSRSLAQLRFSVGVALASNDDAFARRILYQAVIAAERNAGVPSFQGVALQLKGLLDNDVQQLAQAVEVLSNCPRPLLRAGATVDYATALLAVGRRAEGVHHLEQALLAYEGLHSPGPAAATRRILYSAGVRRRRTAAPERPAFGWDSLTDAEQTVARLIAGGHTNRSAAHELTVSANTVGTHLNSIFAKLGVRSRVQLANAVRERSTVPAQ